LQRKRPARYSPTFVFKCFESLCSHRTLLCLETVQTENWAATLRFWAWLEWNLASVATLGTRCREHLAALHALILALVAAVLAALWSGKTALSVESLLTFRESEWRTAVAAL
jgi:hypothetical protein